MIVSVQIFATTAKSLLKSHVNITSVLNFQKLSTFLTLPKKSQK